MRFKRTQPQSEEFQLAPMVDVLFILLIFFIVTSSYQAIEKELSIALPDAEHSSEVEQSGRDILINVTKEGNYIINRKSYTLPQLKDLLDRIKNVLDTKTILIRADVATKYQAIVDVMDLCAELKISKVSFVTQNEE